MTAFGTALLGTSIAFAIIYGAVFCWRDGSAIKTIVKTLSLGIVCVYAAMTGAPWLLVAALAASTAGDAALAARGDRRFLAGLCSFALAHLFYVILFWQLIEAFDMTPLVLTGVVFAVLAVSTAWWLLPYAGQMKLPVAIYVILISAMGILSVQIGGWVMIGALAFVASDFLLSLQLFRLPENFAFEAPVSVVLWALYYGGQLAIFLALTAA